MYFEVKRFRGRLLCLARAATTAACALLTLAAGSALATVVPSENAAPLPWLARAFPSGLVRPGPGGLDVWQWIALPIAAFIAFALGALAGRAGVMLCKRVARRTNTKWDDAVLDRAAAPLMLFAVVGAATLLVPSLALPASIDDGFHRAARAMLFLAFFWALLRSADVARDVAVSSTWAREHASAVALAPLATRVLKVIVFAVGVVAMISELGYPVASLVAGLGIGGIAIALAAQKTVENLFGAFSLGADQPFREGDFVKIEDFVGTVEAIGLRSTRFRTLDRTIISIPNGKLADMRLETFAARDRIRLACDVGLVYETTSTQMREVLAGLEVVLREHPKIWPDAVVVRFKELAASSLNIEVMAWFTTSDWGEFQLIRQDILLRFMEVIESAGTSFAFPTQTLHVYEESRSAAARARA